MLRGRYIRKISPHIISIKDLPRPIIISITFIARPNTILFRIMVCKHLAFNIRLSFLVTTLFPIIIIINLLIYNAIFFRFLLRMLVLINLMEKGIRIFYLSISRNTELNRHIHTINFIIIYWIYRRKRVFIDFFSKFTQIILFLSIKYWVNIPSELLSLILSFYLIEFK